MLVCLQHDTFDRQQINRKQTNRKSNVVVVDRALETYHWQVRRFYLGNRKFKIYFLGIMLAEYRWENMI